MLLTVGGPASIANVIPRTRILLAQTRRGGQAGRSDDR